MKNFPIIDKETGREYWISRSVAVVALVYAYDNQLNEYILANQRGKGTPDPEYVGKWCLPCGYVDFDETVEEAVIREVYEETGLKLELDEIELININSDPKSDKRQNITLRFECIPKCRLEKFNLSTCNSEPDEVSDVKFISINDIDEYEWAFNHKDLIMEFNSLYQNLII